MIERQGNPERDRRTADPRRGRRARAGDDDHRQCRRTAREGNRPARRRRHQSPRDGRAGRRSPRMASTSSAARRCTARGCESFGDHRIAMAFAIAGLFAEGETIIADTECVNTSYPGFSRRAGKDHQRAPAATDSGHQSGRWRRKKHEFSPHRHRHRWSRRQRQKQRRPDARPPHRIRLCQYRRHVPRGDLAGRLAAGAVGRMSDAFNSCSTLRISSAELPAANRRSTSMASIPRRTSSTRP